MPSQKYHTNMGPIRKRYKASELWTLHLLVTFSRLNGRCIGRLTGNTALTSWAMNCQHSYKALLPTRARGPMFTTNITRHPPISVDALKRAIWRIKPEGGHFEHFWWTQCNTVTLYKANSRGVAGAWGPVVWPFRTVESKGQQNGRQNAYFKLKIDFLHSTNLKLLNRMQGIK